MSLSPAPGIVRGRSRSSARSIGFSARRSTYHWSLGLPVHTPVAGDGDEAVETERQISRSRPSTSLPVRSGDEHDTAISESSSGLDSASAPTSAPIGNSMVTAEEFRNFGNVSWVLHRRNMRNARTNSASLYVLENQLQRLNENLNTVIRRLNHRARFLRVNHPVCNIGRMREAVLDFVDRIAVPDPCGDGDSDTETGYNMYLIVFQCLSFFDEGLLRLFNHLS